jgi:hypothetical protein
MEFITFSVKQIFHVESFHMQSSANTWFIKTVTVSSLAATDGGLVYYHSAQYLL